MLDDRSYSRVIILSDGDANIGAAQPEALLNLIRGKVKEGVTVTTAGFGMGNYRDELMQKFANAGNGNHHYIDSPWTARRVFVEELGSTLEVVAQDVKLQVEFDPKSVKRYRLVGYENRTVADRDFRNDKVDGGEIGTGHSVTALYELELINGIPADGLATVRVRAKKPRATEAGEWAFGFRTDQARLTFANASSDFRFATAVMASAELFRRSTHARSWKLADVLAIARASAGESAERKEFVSLLEQADARQVLAAVR
jgi:Ca-activated chloride channel family protein